MANDDPSIGEDTIALELDKPVPTSARAIAIPILNGLHYGYWRAA